MLLTGYRTEFCRPPNPAAQHLRCVAYLNQDIGEALPYLNTVLRGHQFIKQPPSLTLKYNGKLITLYSKEIGINIVKDEAEAESILTWLKQEINDAWQKRVQLTPSYKTPAKPAILNILKLLPKTNCRECGHPTCLVFAALLTEGTVRPEDCPPLDKHKKIELQNYLAPFK